MTVDALVKHITALPKIEREDLFDRLDDIYGEDEDATVEIPEDVRRILEERDAAYEADPTNLRTWEQLMESVSKQK